MIFFMNVSVLLQTVSFPSLNLHSNINFQPVSQAQIYHKASLLKQSLVISAES